MEKKSGSKLVAVLVIVISIVAILVIYQLTIGAKAAQYEDASGDLQAPTGGMVSGPDGDPMHPPFGPSVAGAIGHTHSAGT